VSATITLPSGSGPGFLAITADGKRLYVPDAFSNDVLVVSTASNSVIATIPVGSSADAVVITPDGAHAYVVRNGAVSVLDTSANTVVQSIPAQVLVEGAMPLIAITPAGSDVYVAGGESTVVQAIATASNTVIANIPLFLPCGVTVAPDGSKVYVTLPGNGAVSVIDAATNTVEPSSIPVGSFPCGLAVTPDGGSLYVANGADNTVSVIATATNTVVATIPVGAGPLGIAIANLSAPLAALTIDNLVINNNLHEQGDFTLGTNTGGIDLAHQPLTLTVNNFSLTIPAGSFKQVGGIMHFVFNGTLNGLKVNFNLQAEHGSSTQFEFVVDVHGVSIGGPNPATVGLKIGHNSGTTTAAF
jgi:YVTN family beta-propeller protein